MEIKAYNIHEALEYLKEEEGISCKHLIELGKGKLEDFPIELLPDGYVVGSEIYPPGENTNKSQFSTVDNIVFKGTKKWNSKYIIVWDKEGGSKTASNLSWDNKGDAVKEARNITESSKRTTFVILGKSPYGFKREQARVSYKPSQKQKLGLYEFKYKIT